MLFNSVQFAIFLPIVFIIYWAIPDRYRRYFLLIASYIFYMSWNPKYIVLIVFQSVISYYAGIRISKDGKKENKRTILRLAVIAEAGLLFIFKYYNFAIENYNILANIFGIRRFDAINIILPVGISFYTFQTIGYVADVYMGKCEPEKSLITYCAYISYFPQLVAGPIERSVNLMPQIKKKKEFNYDQAVEGLKYMLLGFFKKLCIADKLAPYVDAVYADPAAYNGGAIAVAVIFFTFQIYCDFSGYSDIAIGVSKLLGIDLMNNFAGPYTALSVKEFWDRWHISLSTWIRDYIYIPLGGNRCSRIRSNINLLISFLISGLWHGANWTFVAWGAIHGMAVVACRYAKKLIDRLKKSMAGKALLWLVCFTFLNLSWVLFRAENFKEALYMIGHVFKGIDKPAEYMHTGLIDFRKNLPGIVLCLGLLSIYDVVELKYDIFKKIKAAPAVARHVIYTAMIVIIIVFRAQSASEFVYFQF